MLNSIASPEDVLSRYWNYDSFRPLQKDIIESVLSGTDTFALLPTGGGKSICYQVPALCSEGVCIVISPLISLMNDQVTDLKNRNIKAALINSFMSKNEIDQMLDNIIYGQYKLLYISPERIQSELFLERFKRMNVSFIAVDEAHCISQWGFDFRPSYLNINSLRLIKEVPMLALTATATDNVVNDIVINLELKKSKRFKKSFSRENILFEVIRAEDKFRHLLRWSKKVNGSGIIYVRNRKKCKEIASYLRNEGVSSMYYHAGVNQEMREKVQDDWMQNKTKVIVATNAFGMGIDKSDVRFVIHLDLPDSLEAFYQEAGRAGRDGKSSNSIVLYDDSDLKKAQSNFETAYPEVEEIKLTYHQLCQYYQIAKGSRIDQSFAFNLTDFSDRYKKSKQKVFSSMKFLEKNNLISLSDGIFQPSYIQILKGKTDILKFRREHESYDEIISFLLRAYAGILEQNVKIVEEDIAKRIKLPLTKVKQQLNYLKKINLIHYHSRNIDPLVSFNQPAIDSDNLGISNKEYLNLKDAAFQRMKAMLSYVNSKDKCRSLIILNYFDENPENKFCGHCDVCLKRTKKNVNSLSVEKSILKVLGNSTLRITEIENLLPEISPDDIKKTCRNLCRDEVLILQSGGKLKLSSLN